MKAFLVVDIQNDFMPGGALIVPGADEVVPMINRLIEKFPLVVASQDWHPSDHVSFHPQGVWPVHCVRYTPGAELVPQLNKKNIASCFFKGTDREIDGYSAFFDNAHLKSTGLSEFLFSRQVDEIYIAGVATDYCVLYSTLDALELGFSVVVIIDACRPINLKPGDGEHALAKMVEQGAKLMLSSDVVSSIAT